MRASSPDDPRLAAWMAQVDARELYRDRTWHLLVQYEPGLLGGFRSRMDDVEFFLAPNGKTDPRAEMQATLAGFLQPPTGENDELGHPRCRFPARFDFLRAALDIDPATLPLPACAVYDRVYERLKPASVTLIFPSAYVNSPASMFGHTLLVFDSAGGNRLLAKAMNYAAVTGQTFGPAFVFASMTGLYRGHYAVMNYHEKVQSYNAINHRDIWEYQLDYTQEQVDRIFAHAWELQNRYSYYYFFDENCAGNLLSILELGRPDLDLSGQFYYQVIPIDVVKAVTDAGLVRDVHYRPSTTSLMRAAAETLPREVVDAALALARNDVDPSTFTDRQPDPALRRAGLDLAARYCQYLYTEREITPETYRGRYLKILKARSREGGGEDDPDLPVPTRPETGHDPARYGVGGGVHQGEAFTALRLRMAYHTLDDADAGYQAGAQVQFLTAEGRYHAERKDWELHNLWFAEVTSISPRGPLFQPVCWKFGIGLGQMDFRRGRDELVAKLDTGSGMAWASASGDTLGYLFLEAAARGGSLLPADYALGTGPAAGVITTWNPDHKTHLRLAGRRYGFAEPFNEAEASLTHSLRLSRNRLMTLEARVDHLDGRTTTTTGVFLHGYF